LTQGARAGTIRLMSRPRRRADPRPLAAGAVRIAICVFLAGCTVIPSGFAGVGGDDAGGVIPCSDTYSAARCDLMTLSAAIDLGVEPDAIAGLAIVHEPTPTDANGNHVLVTLGGAPQIHAQVTLKDGTSRGVNLGCGGVDMRPVCTGQPALRGGDYIGMGYHDVPCAGEPPDGCATPVPAPDAASEANAIPLRIGRVDIPIDHVGDYKVRLGTATLPNGWLSNGSFGFVDDWPDGVTILSGQVDLAIESLEPDGKPFDNVYAHGRREGVERVAADLVFHVDRFEPCAVLPIRDVLVD